MPVARKYAYFDHAAVAPLPSPTSEAIQGYAKTGEASGDVHWLQWSAGVRQLRRTAAELIHAAPDEIALVNSTTQGLNIVASGFPWKAGDNVILPDNEFPSNSLPWKQLNAQGVETRTAKSSPEGSLSLESIGELIDDRTRLIAISWVGFASGFRIDVEELCKLAHSKGVLVCLDAIQGLGAFPLNVKETKVDFLCADGHKWMLGPEGAGILYIAQQHWNLLRPVGVGWGSLESGGFTPGSEKLKETPAVYEGGTTNMPGMLGLGASLQTLVDLGAGQPNSPVAAAIMENVQSIESACKASDLTVHLPAEEHRSGIVGITWPEARDDTDYMEARKALLEHDVVTSVRGGRLRVATHAYNNQDDIDRLVHGLHAFRSRN